MADSSKEAERLLAAPPSAFVEERKKLAKQLRAKIAHRWLTRFTCDDPLGLTVVRCAWCGRMRTSDGKLWLISAASASEITRSLRVSHGLCPGCKKQKWLSASVENQAMLAGGCVESAGQEARN